jgi:hypothetical protein
MNKLIFFFILLLASNSARAMAGEILVVAGPNFPIKNALTKDQVRMAFLGKPASVDGVQIHALDRKEHSVKTNFYKQIVGRSSVEMKAYWSEQVFTSIGYPPPAANDLADLKKLLSDSKDEISYVDGSENTSGLNVLLRVSY